MERIWNLDVLICLHLYLWGKMKEGKDEEVGRRGGWPRIVFLYPPNERILHYTISPCENNECCWAGHFVRKLRPFRDLEQEEYLP
jgi:hypothetical protein